MNIISLIMRLFFLLDTIEACHILSNSESRKDNNQFGRQLHIYDIQVSLTYQYFMVFCKEELGISNCRAAPTQ